jgi:hypothetical protein
MQYEKPELTVLGPAADVVQAGLKLGEEPDCDHINSAVPCPPSED